MARFSRGENSPKRGEKEHISLAAIRGIGSMKKQWLKSLGIVTIQDLAAASAEAIATHFKQEGRAIATSEIDEWIAQAQALVLEWSSPGAAAETSKSAPLPDLLSPEPLLTNMQLSESDEPLVAIAAPVSIDPVPVAEALGDRWQTIATFTVEFQTQQGDGQTENRTIVRHVKTDAVSAWSGIESEQIPQWILDQLNTDKPLETNAPVVLEITQLRMVSSQRIGAPMVANKTHRLFPSSIKAGEPFTLEASMCFSGLPASFARQQLVYRAQCQAHNLSSGVTTDLGDTIANVPIGDKASYTALFPDLSLQQPGAYRLKVLVTLQNAVAVPACFKVPMLQVI